MTLVEDKLEFDFKGMNAVKFDETDFYKSFTKLEYGKGVDFIAYKDDTILLIEVKDFKGFERDNYERFKVRNKFGNSEESLDLEISKKVRESLACIFASSFKEVTDIEHIYKQFEKKNKSLMKQKPEIKVMLFLEGDFEDTKRMFLTIQRSIKNQLAWLNANILIENISTLSANSHISVSRIP